MICCKRTVRTISSVLFAISLLIWILWTWLQHEVIPNLITIQPGLTFDYIIVGAGTAGSVLANRLSQNSNISVLLVEAGDRFGPLSKVPLLATVAQKTRNDWAFKSVSQKYSSRGLINNMQSLPRGKGLGGSSVLNYMLHFEGLKKDFYNWEKLGALGWNYNTMKKYIPTLQKSCSANLYNGDNTQFCYQTTSELVNQSKPNDNIWKVPYNYSKITEAFIAASGNFFSTTAKFDLSQYNIKNGIRWSVYENFLKPSFKRDNLKILTNSVVSKVKIRNGRATSVMIATDSLDRKDLIEIHAKNEIILSAGTYQTPQILQLSGIGPTSHLKQINIKPIVHSIGVGANLHDHLNLPIYVTINESASITINKVLSPLEILHYLRTGEGHFGNFGVLGQITAKTDDFGVLIFATGSIDEDALMALSNFEQSAFRSLFPFYHSATQEGFLLLSTCLQPKSRGKVYAKSENFRDNPTIDPNFLHKKSDIKCMLRGLRLAIKMLMSEPLQAIGAKVHWPKLKNCANFGPFERDFITNEPSDHYLECIIRSVGLSSHHPGGTCAMGTNKNNVVDHHLRVRGVNGLRVVDASVLPTPVSGTPNSVLIGIAKRASKLILTDE